MIKIGIYSRSSEQKKDIKKSMKEYFDNLKIESEVRVIRAKFSALKNLAERYAQYNIVLICEENKITYIKRNVVSHLKNYCSQIVGWTDLPLSTEKIDEIIFNA